MKNRLFVILLVLLPAAGSLAKEIQEVDYRRNSIYSIVINHTDQTLAPYIAKVFCASPVPDKYNDHDLSVKVITHSGNLPAGERGEDFLISNHVASHLVAKWFDRDSKTGICNMDLIKSRGLYSASEFDKLIASHSLRGNAMLEDAGEDLIANTFVIVNDIRYIDKEQQGQTGAAVVRFIGGLLGGLVGGDLGKSVAAAGNALGDMVETLKGFKVKVYTYLYRLQWDEETAAIFYDTMYSEEYDPDKMKAWMVNRDMFRLKYVGRQLSDGQDVSFLGVNLDTPDQMIQKACVRAIDANVANLAKNFEPFKVKVKLTSTKPIVAPIGKKEEIDENSRFEVLQKVEQSSGRIVYRQVAIIQPVKGKIWDNRYMAAEENAEGANLGGTTFRKVSGSAILPGMLIRELK